MAILTDRNQTPGSTLGALWKAVGTQYLPVTPPITIGVWVYISDTYSQANPVGSNNSQQTLIGIARDSSNRMAGLYIRNPSASNFYIFLHYNGTAAVFSPATATSGVTYGRWHYVCGALDNTGITAGWTNSKKIYSSANDTFVKNTAVADTTTGVTPWDRISINGMRNSASTTLLPDGIATAEAAWWDVALSDEEIRSLAKGIKPTLVRPQSLVEYIPGIRTASGGLTGTSVNTTVIGQRLDATSNFVPVNFSHPRRYG